MKSIRKISVRVLACLVVSAILVTGCSNEKESIAQEQDTEDSGFMSIGSFAVNPLGDGLTEVRDGAGRTLILVPRGEEVPKGYDPSQVVRIPVKRVVAYSSLDIAILKALGVVGDVLTGVVTKKVQEVFFDTVKGKVDKYKDWLDFV